jgi:hypothetical protein
MTVNRTFKHPILQRLYERAKRIATLRRQKAMLEQALANWPTPKIDDRTAAGGETHGQEAHEDNAK